MSLKINSWLRPEEPPLTWLLACASGLSVSLGVSSAHGLFEPLSWGWAMLRVLPGGMGPPGAAWGREKGGQDASPKAAGVADAWAFLQPTTHAPQVHVSQEPAGRFSLLPRGGNPRQACHLSQRSLQEYTASQGGCVWTARCSGNWNRNCFLRDR